MQDEVSHYKLSLELYMYITSVIIRQMHQKYATNITQPRQKSNSLIVRVCLANYLDFFLMISWYIMCVCCYILLLQRCGCIFSLNLIFSG